MRNSLAFALGAAFCGLATPVAAQQAMPAPDNAPQVQANPVGSPAPAVTTQIPAQAGDPVPPSMPADPNYHAGAYVGALSTPPAAKTYPRCSATIHDSCQQPARFQRGG